MGPRTQDPPRCTGHQNQARYCCHNGRLRTELEWRHLRSNSNLLCIACSSPHPPHPGMSHSYTCRTERSQNLKQRCRRRTEHTKRHPLRSSTQVDSWRTPFGPTGSEACLQGIDRTPPSQPSPQSCPEHTRLRSQHQMSSCGLPHKARMQTGRRWGCRCPRGTGVASQLPLRKIDQPHNSAELPFLSLDKLPKVGFSARVRMDAASGI